MVKRVVTGIALVALLLLVALVCPLWVAKVLVVVLCVWAVMEFLSALKTVKSKGLHLCAILMAAAVPLVTWFFDSFLSWRILVTAFVLALFCVWMRDRENKTADFVGISSAFLTATVLPLFFSSIIRILSMENGRALLFMPFIAANVTDTFAFFIGSAFGKHKLAPYISPKKSVEGAVGGLVGCVCAFLLYGVILQSGFEMTVNLWALALYGVVGSVAGMLGDLALSLVKREHQIKDYGNVLPGHGGLLDRFDSLLFAAPAIEILLCLLPAVAV